MNHTPGPWHWTNGTDPIDINTYESPGYYNNPELMGPNGEYIIGCDEYWVVSPILEHDEMVANAHLIAAAPNIKAALDGLLNRYLSLVNSGDCGNWNPETEDEVIAARAALAKVKP